MISQRDSGRDSMAFVAVGANVNPEDNIVAALVLLTQRIRVAHSSTFYRTEPIGPASQPQFVNGLWLLETILGPRQVRDDVLRPVERELGRVRSRDKYAPRVIDLDLVLYDDLVMDDGRIRLPHPDIVRPFVYVPVLEVLEACGPNDRERIAGLLPTDVSPTLPGQALPELTEKLRSVVSR